MKKTVHIIGCGNIGYYLTQLLFLKSEIDELHIWDPGEISTSDSNTYPKKYVGKGFLKIDVLPIICNLLDRSNTTSIKTHGELVSGNFISTIAPGGIVVDCTDSKNKSQIQSTFSVSYDGDIAVFDSRRPKVFNEIDYPYYQYRKIHRRGRLFARAVWRYITLSLPNKNDKRILDLTNLWNKEAIENLQYNDYEIIEC